MTPSDIEVFRKVSSSTRSQVQCYDRVVFGENSIYGAFFTSPEDILKFRIEQAATGAIVSGSVIVKVLSRLRFKPADLDVFVKGCHALRVGNVLVLLGFKFAPLAAVRDGNRLRSVEQSPDFAAAVETELRSCNPNTGTVEDRYENTTIAGVFNFEREGGARIQIVATRGEPVETILGFHSTAVMNIATATQVISLYPRTTFVHHKSLFLRPPNQAVFNARVKYTSRGWSCVDTIPAVDYLEYGSELSGCTRWVGDPRCWTINLTPLPQDASLDSAYAHLLTTSWNIRQIDATSARIVKTRLTSPLLSNSYVVTWEAEQAKHEDPDASVERQTIAIEAGVVEETGPDGGSEVDDESVTGSSSDLSETSPSEHECEVAALDMWNYMAAKGDCYHGTIDDENGLDQAVTAYIEGLYPYIRHSETTDYNILRLRRRFSVIPTLFPEITEPATLPTAHVVLLVLDCVQRVVSACSGEDVKFNVQFTKRTINGREHICTQCVIVVPTRELKEVRRRVGNWTEGTFAYARLTTIVRDFI
ncbi:hypothetical protein VNI00_005222 [Paramarasmius palmivorus]|uniref:Uncharacterized protein n=1 Tax=Paramarasmius palmivorus TaxID=297713 RepID=A0AAW0DJE6_9AGAR